MGQWIQNEQVGWQIPRQILSTKDIFHTMEVEGKNEIRYHEVVYYYFVSDTLEAVSRSKLYKKLNNLMVVLRKIL